MSKHLVTIEQANGYKLVVDLRYVIAVSVINHDKLRVRLVTGETMNLHFDITKERDDAYHEVRERWYFCGDFEEVAVRAGNTEVSEEGKRAPD